MEFYMSKVLFVAAVDSHIRHFHIPYLKYFKENGYEVHVATADDENETFNFCDKKHKITFERSPFKLNNIKAIKQMFNLLVEEKYEIVHCNTPMGSVVTRLAVRKLAKRKMERPTVIYTAHGFHFFKGAPLLNWLVYYPVEKWLSKYTDKLITINNEDYNYAKKFKAKKVYKIDGVGVDAGKFNIVLNDKEKEQLRKELSSINDSFKINKEDIVITYVAELIPRKNQDMIIDVMNELVHSDESCSDDNCSSQNIKLLLVGTGALHDKYTSRIKKLHLESNILLAGYRRDVPKILKISDIAVSCSKHEGLPFNLVEAQMSGLPIVATDCRGNNEVVIENQNGYLVKDKEKFKHKLLKLLNSEKMRTRMGKNALENSKKYKLSRIIVEMKKIYDDKI